MYDRVKPLNFALCYLQQRADLGPYLRRRFPQSAIDQLQMDIERVKWITDFVRHARGKQCQSGKALAFDRLFGHASVLGNIPQNNGISDEIQLHRVGFCSFVFKMEWRHIEIEKSVPRVKNFYIPTHDALVRAQ